MEIRHAPNMTPNLEQIAAQTIVKLEFARPSMFTESERGRALDTVLSALHAATAQQHAPTQGGDWAEAAAKEIWNMLFPRSLENPFAPWTPAFAAIIRRHAPQPDLASVRSAVKKAMCGDKITGPSTDAQIDRIMSALTPLLGANDDDTALIDWAEANVGRIEALEPHPPSLLWKWHVFLKQKDPTQSLNSFRAAIRTAMQQTGRKGEASQ